MGRYAGCRSAGAARASDPAHIAPERVQALITIVVAPSLIDIRAFQAGANRHQARS
jgi:hypothetical protein